MSRILFVYGTLQKNQRNHERLSDSIFMGRALVCGRLFQFPFFDFPILRQHPDDLVHGELYTVREPVLTIQDAAEKWYKRKAVQGWLIRETKSVPICFDLYEGLKYLPYFLARKLPGGVWPA